MSQPHDSKIDYLKHSFELTGRRGKVLNIVTGCKHHESDICNIPCYAKRLAETRLKDSPAYPYGFEPTFHPERVKAVGHIQCKLCDGTGRQMKDRMYGTVKLLCTRCKGTTIQCISPKLIFLNDMGDVGGDWDWKIHPNPHPEYEYTDCGPKRIALEILNFANLNPQHILLLLTKNPSWYRLLKNVPDNVYCGFTATNLQELDDRLLQMFTGSTGGLFNNIWASLEPWHDFKAPDHPGLKNVDWVVIGGQTGPDMPVSPPTARWLDMDYCPSPIFVKDNTQFKGTLREYPEAFKV